MAKRITRKQMKHDEFVEATFDFAHWLEEHWAKVLAWVAAGIVVTLAVLGWNAWSNKKSRELSERLAQSIDLYEQAEAAGFSDAGGVSAMLAALEEVADAGGRGTEAVARYYRGATLYHTDRLDEARAELERVVSAAGADVTVGATARLILARVEAAAGQTDRAVTLLQGMADDPSAVVPPARSLLELGRIRKEAGEGEEARALWQRVVDEYPQSVSAVEARSLLQ